MLKFRYDSCYNDFIIPRTDTKAGAMPLRIHFRSAENLIIVEHIGSIPDEEFYDSYTSLYRNEQFEKSMNRLIDLRKAESYEISSDVLYKLSGFIRRQYTGDDSRPKIAVVAPETLFYGLSRMFENQSQGIPWEYKVFKNMDEALAWLDLPDDYMNDFDKDSE